MPVLWIGGNQKRRVQQEDRTRNPGMQDMRQEVQSACRHHLRLEEDSVLGMDRVPGAPFPVPLRQNNRLWQQKCGNYGALLAFQGLSCGRRHPVRHSLFRKGVDRRDILSQMEVEIRHQRRQAAQRSVEKSVLRMLCDGRKAMRAASLRRGKAKLR